MEDKDLLKQNSGSQQGNLHIDADEGRNEGKQGSTLGKSEETGAATTAHDDEDNNSRHGDMLGHDSQQQPDTLGNP